MKRPFQDAPTIWHAIVVVGVVILLAFLFSLCGCRTNQRTEDRGKKTDSPAPSSVLRPPPPAPPMPPIRKVDKSKVRLKKAADIQEGNGGGAEVISNQLSVIRLYDAPCSNFVMCRLEYHPCATNLLDLDADTEVDTNGLPIGQWYSSTNIIRWQAEAGHYYIPEWSADLVNWYSNRYLSTNAPGLMETMFFQYVVENRPQRFYRIRREEAQSFQE